MSDAVVLSIIGVLLAIFVVVATKRRWVVWKGGRGIANLTAFHDFQPKDKQHAIEMVVERKAGKQLESQKSGEDQ